MSKKKILTLVLALALVATCAIGGTVAWLYQTTGTVTNTFTMGDIKIELKRGNETISNDKTVTTENFVPGQLFKDDAAVIVKANSEKCYLFIRVDVKNNTVNGKQVLEYTLNSEWTALEGYTNIYYKEINERTTTEKTVKVFENLTDNNEFQIKANEELEKSHLGTINESDTKPTISISAAAIQHDYVGADAKAAFDKLPAAFKNAATTAENG